MYAMYASASNNTLSYTHVSSYVVRRVHPLDQEVSLLEIMWPKTKISCVLWNSYTNGSAMRVYANRCQAMKSS